MKVWLVNLVWLRWRGWVSSLWVCLQSSGPSAPFAWLAQAWPPRHLTELLVLGFLLELFLLAFFSTEIRS